MMHSVYPSGAAVAQASVPMTPPAPPRLSTNTCWPSCVLNCIATSRPTTSLLPPGGKGTIKRTGRLGEFWARAPAASAASSIAAAMNRDNNVGMMPPGASPPIGGIVRVLLLFGLEPAQHGGPFENAVRPPRARLVHVSGVRQHVFAGMVSS